MDERVAAFRIGVLVVATLTITTILIFIVAGMPEFAASSYTVHAKFRDAPGVTVDTPVRKSGILIGRVSDVQLEDDGALVTMDLRSAYKIRTSEECRISTENVFGDAVIEFVPGPESPGEPQFLVDSEVPPYLEGVVAGTPRDVVMAMANLEDDMVSTLESVRTAGQDLSNLARNVNSSFGDNTDQLTRVLQKSEAALDNMTVAMETFNSFVGDDELRGQLKDGLEDIPLLLEDAQQTLASMRS